VGSIAFKFDDDLLDGKGWSIRAIMEIADKLGGDLILLEADLASRRNKKEVVGMAPEWIRSLLDPVKRGQMDLVVSAGFNLHYADVIAHANLTYPTAEFGVQLSGLFPRGRALRGNRPPTCFEGLDRDEARRNWNTTTGGHGIDAWIVTNTLSSPTPGIGRSQPRSENR